MSEGGHGGNRDDRGVSDSDGEDIFVEHQSQSQKPARKGGHGGTKKFKKRKLAQNTKAGF